MQFYQFCRSREKKSQSFSSKTVHVSREEMAYRNVCLCRCWTIWRSCWPISGFPSLLTRWMFGGSWMLSWACLMLRGGRSWLPWGCRRGTGMPALMVMCRPYGIVEELPECGETIGGTSHMLLDTNRIATHMDGATRSSYRWGVPEQWCQGGGAYLIKKYHMLYFPMSCDSVTLLKFSSSNCFLRTMSTVRLRLGFHGANFLKFCVIWCCHQGGIISWLCVWYFDLNCFDKG